MRKIGPPDIHHLNAASGWIDLGAYDEAKVELKKISARYQHRLEVLEAQWQLLAAEKHWEKALEASRDMIERYPNEALGWIGQSFCLHELKRTKEAWEFLLGVAEQFRDIGTIPYNLACYACQMGKLDTAKRWLDRAVEILGKEKARAMALEDHDLEPLWTEIKAW